MNLVYGQQEDLDVTLVQKLKKEYCVIQFEPQDDENVKLTKTYVNINSKNIDKDEVAAYIGMVDDFDPDEFAVGCVDYYGVRFWGGGSTVLKKEEAQKAIQDYMKEED